MAVKLLASLAAVAGVTFAGTAFKLNPTALGLIYLVTVLALSAWSGLLSGIAAALIAAACFNYFFLPPVGTWTIEEPSNWVALASFLLASFIASQLADRLRRQLETAERRRTELEQLYRLSIDLFRSFPASGSLDPALASVLESTGGSGGAIFLFEGSTYRQSVAARSGPLDDDVEDVVAGVGRHRRPFEYPSNPNGRRDVFLPLLIGSRAVGVLLVRNSAAAKGALDSAASLLAVAVERVRFVAENAHVEALRQSDELKTALLRAVSHDLATPLTSLSVRFGTLRRELAGQLQPLETLTSIELEVGTLRRRIENLLTMARLEAGTWAPRAEPTPAADLFRSVREHLTFVESARPLVVHVDPSCPDIDVDPSLAVEILVNLVENAHRFSPAGTAVELDAGPGGPDAKFVELRVLDRGPGVHTAPGSTRRGSDADAGHGLGLEIATALVLASGGSLSLEDREGGGTVACVSLPAASFELVEREDE